MVEMERKLTRKKLDAEMKAFRIAAREANPTNGLLRAIWQALSIPVKEIAERMGVGRSTVNDLEASERRQTISMRSLGRMAEAMGCKVVYGVVPLNGRTLEYVAEERLWKKVLGAGTEGLRDLESAGGWGGFPGFLRAALGQGRLLAGRLG
jgi:transcriptional regulator with XRE-family HTH domain